MSDALNAAIDEAQSFERVCGMCVNRKDAPFDKRISERRMVCTKVYKWLSGSGAPMVVKDDCHLAEGCKHFKNGGGAN